MTDIDDVLDDAREAATDFLNSEGRSAGHVALGFAITAGFALFATALATGLIDPRRTPRHLRGQNIRRLKSAPVTERPTGALSLILPAVFSATTLAAVRVWNAPSRPERSKALGLWAAAQAVNAVWLALRPVSLGRQVVAAMSSAGLTAAFAHEARKLDDDAGKVAAPMGAGVRFANMIDRKLDEQRTVH